MLVQAGYIVFIPDTLGSGGRREFMDHGEEYFFKDSRRSVNNVAISLGLNLTGLIVWESMRLVDYILTRGDCSSEVSAAGFHTGGAQSIYLSAVDSRIKNVVTGGCYFGFKDGYLMAGDACSCNYVPFLLRWFDFGDLGAMIAPRQLFIEAA